MSGSGTGVKRCAWIVKQKFYKILGKDAKIDIEYIDEIPVLKSGKRKYIENIMKGW